MRIANELRNIEPWDPEYGMPVKVVWKPENERQGIRDSLYQSVYEWVKTMK